MCRSCFFRASWMLLGFLAFAAAASAQPRIAINELMYAPVAPEPEWIEFFNYDSAALQLSGLSIKVSSKTVALPSIAIPANGFVVLTKDATSLRAFRNQNFTIVQVALPNLRNSGDTIVLLQNGTVIDSAIYQPSWGGQPVANAARSIERRDVSASGTSKDNWGSSIATSGATPGEWNSIAVYDYDLAIDTVISIFENDSILVGCSIANVGKRNVDSATVILRQNKSAVAEAQVGALQSGMRTTIQFGLSHGTQAATYTAVVHSSNDTNFVNDTASISTPAAIASHAVVINEVMFAPLKPEPEWIELLNTSQDTIEISGTQLQVSHYIPKVIGAQAGIIPPDSLLILTPDDSILSVLRKLPRERCISLGFDELSNSGSEIVLRDQRGETIDSVAYDGSWISAEGYSIERIDPLASGTIVANWFQCEDSAHATPLRPNSVRRLQRELSMDGVKLADSALNVMVFNRGYDTIQSVTLRVSRFGIDTTLYEINHTIAPLDSISFPIALSSGAYGVLPGSITIIDSLDRRRSYDTLDLLDTIPIPADSVFINEIMYDPRSNSCEWVEMFNGASSPVSVHQLELQSGEKLLRSFDVNDTAFIRADNYWLFVADTSGDSSLYNAFPTLRDNPHLTVFNRSLELSNDSTNVILRSADETVLDSVHYLASWQTAPVSDPTGISIERISTHASSNDPANWRSSSDPAGGTPLAKNSTAPLLDTTRILFSASFEPNPFSPDGDGFEDASVLTIASGDALSYALRVRLFDARGRLVRTLADGVAFNGLAVLRFDGRNDSGQLLPLGLYTSLIELTSQSPVKLLKRTLGLAIAGRHN